MIQVQKFACAKHCGRLGCVIDFALNFQATQIWCFTELVLPCLLTDASGMVARSTLFSHVPTVTSGERSSNATLRVIAKLMWSLHSWDGRPCEYGSTRSMLIQPLQQNQLSDEPNFGNRDIAVMRLDQYQGRRIDSNDAMTDGPCELAESATAG